MSSGLPRARVRETHRIKQSLLQRPSSLKSLATMGKSSSAACGLQSSSLQQSLVVEDDCLIGGLEDG